MTAQDPSAKLTTEKPTLYAWYVAVILMLVYTLSFIDRKLPFILVQSIKQDLQLSDTQIGLLTGVMFFLVYASVAIPLGALADRSSRKTIIGVAVFAWSALTAVGGFAQNFWQLAASRIGVAVGEAGCTPAAHSMMADYFSPKYRARAIGLYFVGAQLGIVLGLALGGLINDLANWRVAMFLCGAPGVVLTILMFATVKEPARRATGNEVVGAAVEKPTIREGLAAVLSHPTNVHLFIAGVLFTFTGGAVNAFGPAFVMRTYGLTASQTGLSYGLLLGAAGAFGALLGGAVGDRIRRTNPARALFWVAGALFLGAPCLMLALFVQNYPLFLFMLFIWQALAMTYAGPSFSTLQSLVSPRMHGIASAMYVFSLSGLGAALGPLVAGIVSDAMKRAQVDNPLRWSLIILVFPLVWASVHYVFAGRALKRHDAAVAAAATP